MTRSSAARGIASTRCAIIVVMMWAAAARLAAQQGQPSPPATPDSPAIVEQLNRLKTSVGPRWADAVHFWCEAPRANRADDPVIQPAKIFDNVYAIGNVGTVAYVIQTSAGLMMIDALGANQVESDLLPGFTKLGLDPAQVKTILVAHGHADHFGGSAYFQQKFGSKVYVSAADWTLMETPPRGRGPGAPPPAAPPKRDGELRDGESVTLGNITVRAVAVPGHTPGLDGFHHSSPRSRRAARRRAVRRVVADAGTIERRGDEDLHRLGRSFQAGDDRRRCRRVAAEPSADGAVPGLADATLVARARCRTSFCRRPRRISEVPRRDRGMQPDRPRASRALSGRHLSFVENRSPSAHTSSISSVSAANC